MVDAAPLAPLLAALRDLSAWMASEDVPHVLIGGVAASLLGRPRLTRDVDAVVWLDEGRWSGFLTAGQRFGYVPRLSEALAFASDSRVLLVHHRPSGIDADISLGALPFEEETINRARIVEVEGIALRLPAPEDLIIMKAVAHRQRDLVDIESLLEAQLTLDVERIRGWVQAFADALEAPEILADLEALLARHRLQ